ncbi:M48 family metallopeptidase [Kangiella sp. TOML190]|uniref:M48 family metallopeptidase n=1 Tax=Kangiella sp. TOML190 TaxID=2931351 RepID=UPI00203B144C|nr:SprT family zinc-dependent metalloprotease [Kangiella sp. TOML190]
MNLSVKDQIDFTIKRSGRKSVAIHVSHNLVEVRAPYTTSKAFIDKFVAEKRSWIVKQLIEQEHKRTKIYAIEESAKLPFMGYEISLSIEQAKRNGARYVDNHLTLKVSKDTPANRVKQMDLWLLKQAKQQLPELVRLFAQEMGLEDRIKTLKFRKTKTKWGHCTHDGVVQFNPLILLAPERVLHYLIVHELCHLIHQNHSKDYWQLVADYEPNYREAEDWLKRNGHKLWYQ